MNIDPYTPCPGGSGKKIKFCDLCKDHLGDLEKIYKLLEGEQRAACLDLCEKVDSATPDRACVLSIKTLLESQLGMKDRANATLAHFLAKYPTNPVALAEKSIQNAAEGLLPLAIDSLQTALEQCEQNVPGRLLDAISVVGRAALSQGFIQAARGHLMLELGLTQGEDAAGAMQLLMRINNSSDIPIVLKDDAYFEPCPEGAAIIAEFEEALTLAARGAWRSAARAFSNLVEKDAEMPELWHNLAVLRSWLADQEGAVAALRKLATLDIDLDEAVEAEALAQIVDEASSDDEVDLLRAVFDVSDLDRLLEALATTSRVVSMPSPPRIEGDEPPPRAMYVALDRDDVKSGVDIARDDIPLLLARVLVFGRQTDREARLELIGYRGEEIDGAIAILREVASDEIAAQPSSEDVIGHNTAVMRLLTPALRLPTDTPREHAQALIGEIQRDAVFNSWPKLPLAVLDGKTPEDAAADDAQRPQVLAAIMLLEFALAGGETAIDFDALRSKLGLPTAGPISLEGMTAEQLPLARFPRLVASELADDDLVTLYRRAAMTQYGAAIDLLGPEVVSRASLDDSVDKAEAYAIMARHAPSSSTSIELLAKAREAAAAQKESPARWYLEELPLRLERGEPQEAEQIINILRDKHFNEPGVADALYQMLAQVQAMAGQGGATAPHTAQEPAEMVAAAPQAPPSEGKVWTPESEQGSSRGKLWTPD